MTTSPNAPEQPLVVDARVDLTALDAERIATAVEAELAVSTRETYACDWQH